MTTGIPHGPLAGQDLKKLTELSALLCTSEPMRFSAWQDIRQPQKGEVVSVVGNDGQRVLLDGFWSRPGVLFCWLSDRFTYLGEWSDASRKVILAPEGGWAGNPVPWRRVEVETRNGNRLRGKSEGFEWVQGPPLVGGDIVAFSLIEDAKPEGVTDPVYTDGAPVPDDMRIFTSTPDRPAQALSDLAEMDGGLLEGGGAKLAEVDATAQQVKNALAVIAEAINRHTPSPQPMAQLGLVASYVLTSLARRPAPVPEPMQADLRETIARIVDPETFALIAHYAGIERFDGLTPEEREPSVFKGYPELETNRRVAYADADAILSAMQAKSEPEAECSICSGTGVRKFKTQLGIISADCPCLAHPSPSAPNPDLAGLVERLEAHMAKADLQEVLAYARAAAKAIRHLASLK